MLFILFFILFLSTQVNAWAYIDPGSGGYLISSILAAIGSAFAFGSALLIHFFRNVLGKGICFLWRQHRFIFIGSLLAALLGIGFLIHACFYEPSIPKFNSSLSGAHIIDAARISPGYNLYEGKLIDMQGHVLKIWRSTYLGTLDTNGDYYAQRFYKSDVWGRYTWDDKIVWEKNFPIHHELLLTPQNTIITFTKEMHVYNGRKVEFDVILEFDKDGHELQRYSTFDHLKEFHQYHGLLDLDMPISYPIPADHRYVSPSFSGADYDYYHLNSLSLIPPNILETQHQAFTPGNWLISFRHGSMVFILDKNDKSILWSAVGNRIKGHLEGPHSPVGLANGDILLFDNGRYRKWSRLIEIDPNTLNVVWEYRDKGFYSNSQGHVQKLPNGNMLVTETDAGYVFELTPDKKIVWEFYHPEEQNESNSDDPKSWGQRQNIYRMTRYPLEMIDPLLKK